MFASDLYWAERAKGVIQQLRGPNFTQFWPLPPLMDNYGQFTYGILIPKLFWPTVRKNWSKVRSN